MADNNKPNIDINKLTELLQASSNNNLSYQDKLSTVRYNKAYSQLTDKQKQFVDSQEKIVKAYEQQLKYEQSSLRTKRDLKREAAEEYKLIIKSLEAQLKETEDHKQRFDILLNMRRAQQEYDKNQKDYLRMTQELLRAENANVSAKEKQAVLEERSAKAREIYLKYEEDIKKLEKEGNKEAAEKLKSDRKKELEEAGLKGYDKFGRQGLFSALKEDKDRNFNKEGVGAAVSQGFDAFLSSGKVGSAVSSVASSILPAFSAALGPVVAILSSVLGAVGKINKTLDKGVDEAVSVQNDYLGKINSRLYGTDQSFQSYRKYVKDTFGYTGSGNGLVSAFISQKSLLENISKLVDQGVAYNVEERATLLTLSDRMVSTFDVLNPTLERLVRLQQNDVTASQLGYEALLTKFLNENFKDTSYLSGVYDNISAALLDASSQLTSEAATEFNYAAQKWLASLYSVGMSESGVQKLATGIGYLATGNVDALNSDDGLRTLFAAASGGAYSSILTGGLNASTVNDLLKNIVSYLQSIAGDTNKVTKKAMAGVFGGFDLSDLRAVTNLTTENLEKIYASNYAYSQSLQEVVNQLGYVTNTGGDTALTRTSLASIYDTVFENALFSFGLGKVENAGEYRDWKKASLLQQTGSKILSLVGDVMKFVNSVGDYSDLIENVWGGFKAGDIDQLDKWVDSFKATSFYKNLNAEAIKTRGSSYSYESLISGNTVSGISSMAKMGLSGVASGGVRGITSLDTTAAATATKSTVSGTEATRDISALYAELFERQTTAMKVSINSIDYNAASTLSNIITNNVPQTTSINGISEGVLNALSNSMHADAVNEINNKLSGTVEVSMNDNFLEQINTGLSYARGI